MGDENALKIFDILSRKFKLSEFDKKDDIIVTIDECKEVLRSQASPNLDNINNSDFLKSMAAICKSTPAKDNDATPIANPMKNTVTIDQGSSSRPTTPVCLIKSVEDHEHLTIPDYMRRYLNVSDLNNMINSFEAAFNNRIKFQKLNYHKLSKAEKDIRLAMRDETTALKLPPNTQFISEDEWKKCLEQRLVAKLKWASQQLRHLKRIKETRHRQKVYYIIV